MDAHKYTFTRIEIVHFVLNDGFSIADILTSHVLTSTSSHSHHYYRFAFVRYECTCTDSRFVLHLFDQFNVNERLEMYKRAKFKQTRFSCSIKFMEYYLPYLGEIVQ